MPPLLSSFADAVGGLLGIGAGSSTTETSTPDVPSNARDHRSHASPNVQRGDKDITDDILDAELVPAGTKREREAADPALEAAARKRFNGSPSADERRLMGDYKVPANARPIDMPQPGTPRPKPGTWRGGLRPMNTLSTAPHASHGPGGSFKGGPRDVEGIGRLTTVSSQGANVRSAGSVANGYADGFAESVGPVAKKQKVQHGRGHTGVAIVKDSVDLTNEGSEHSPGRNGGESSVKTASPLGNVPARASNRSRRKRNKMFADSESTKVNSLAHPPPKTARKPRDPNESSRGSSQRSSIVELGNGRASQGPGSRYSPFEVPDESHVNPRAAPHGKPQNGLQPHTNLDDGVGTFNGKHYIKRGSEADLRATGNLLMPKQPVSRLSAERVNQRKMRDAQHISPVHGAPSGFFAGYAKTDQQARKEDAPSLRQNFKRDDTQLPRAKDRMQAEREPQRTRVTPIDDSFSSIDELQGENTVKGAAGRAASPQKRSAMSPTVSTSANKRQEIQASLRPSASSVDYQDDESIDSHCPIAAIHCVACIYTTGNLGLILDEKEDRLELYRDGVPVVLQGEQRPVGIDAREVRRIHYSMDCTLVTIDCVPSKVSHSKLCISFQNYQGVLWFLNAMVSMNGSITQQSCTSDGMNKRVNTVTTEVNFQLNQAKKVLAPSSAATNGHARRTEHDEDEDEIKYEVDQEDEAPPKGREQMQSRPLTEALRLTQARKQARTTMNSSVAEGSASRYFSGQPERSTRQTKARKERVPSPPLERWTEIHKPKPWPRSVVYPSQGARRVTVDFDDLSRLDEGEFLNDNTVSFALRRIEENMARVCKEQVHFFSSFFFTALSQKCGKKAFNYDGVKRWTKNNDIFNVPYTVVPICMNLHWFVAIICNLDKISRRPAGLEDAGDNNETDTRQSDAEVESDANEVDAVEVVRVGENVSKAKQKPEPRSGRRPKRKPSGPTFDPDSPLIITLDSFGSAHTAETAILKNYISMEAEAKRGMEVTRDMIRGVTAKGLPEQTNFCDCGVYLVGYVEQFVKDPAKFVEKVASRQLDRQADFASFNPSVKREEMRNELLTLQVEQQTAYREQKKNAAAAKAQTQSRKSEAATTREQPASGQSAHKVTAASESASAPADVAESGQSSKQPAASAASKDDEQEADELEMAPAVPLAQASSPPKAGSAQRDQADKVFDQLFEGDEEMLDNNVDPSVPANTSVQAEGETDENADHVPMERPSPAKTVAHSQSGRLGRRYTTKEPSKEGSLVMEPDESESDGQAEVPDSQGQMPVYA